MRKSILLLIALALIGATSCRGPQSCTGVVEAKQYIPDRYNDIYYLLVRDNAGLHHIRVDQTTYHRYQVGERATIPNPY